MKKIKLVLLVLMLSSVSARACDVCGCSLGGSYYGILPQFSKNFVGLRWSQAKFYAYMDHQGEYIAPEYSHDTYNKVELWGRFYITKRFQVFAFIPYAYNDMNGSEQNISNNGLSDITLLGNYILLNTGEDETVRWKHTWMVGGGVKLPTGKNNLEDNGILVNPNFQLGTGSVDFLANTVYTVRYQKAGFNAETGYKINTRNSEKYLFGNQFHASGQFFFWQNMKSFSFLPNAGLYFEQSSQHKDSQAIQTNTGGYALLATAGLETYYKRVTLGLNYKRPVKQKFNSDEIAEITAKDRWIVSLTYNF
ncbi:MAG TPA: hypothetical protein VGK59_12800 [Ohtaekwangia sp.]